MIWFPKIWKSRFLITENIIKSGIHEPFRALWSSSSPKFWEIVRSDGPCIPFKVDSRIQIENGEKSVGILQFHMTSLAQNNLPEVKNRKKKDLFDLFYLYVNGHASQGSPDHDRPIIDRWVQWDVYRSLIKLQNRFKWSQMLGKPYYWCDRYQWRHDDVITRQVRGHHRRFDQLCCLWFFVINSWFFQ